MKELRDSMSVPDKLFSNLFCDGVSKTFVVLTIQFLIIDYKGGLGWNPGKSLRKVSKEMARMLQKCKTTEPKRLGLNTFASILLTLCIVYLTKCFVD